MAQQLPEDVIIEILCRLPIKTMVGFKCVSKAWNTLISDVCFPRVSRRPLSVSGFLFRDYRCCKQQEHFMGYAPFCSDDVNSDGFLECCCNVLPSEYSSYHVLDCCNGLILLGTHDVPRYFVCNPAIKQCVSVALPQNSPGLGLYRAVLAFSPCESSQYKIIRFMQSNPAQLDIFSSETRNWIRHKLVVELGMWVEQAVYWDGMLYILSQSKLLLLVHLKELTIQVIEVPDRNIIYSDGCIGVSRGALLYAVCLSSGLWVWQLDCDCKDDRFWILKKHTATIYDLVAKQLPYWRLARYTLLSNIYAIHPTSDVIFLGTSYMIFSYHLESRKLELLYQKPTNIERVPSEFFFYLYSPCFIMLHEFSQTNRQSSQLQVFPEIA